MHKEQTSYLDALSVSYYFSGKCFNTSLSSEKQGNHIHVK